MKNMILSFVLTTLSFSAYSTEFKPIKIDTNKFKINAYGDFRSEVGQDLKICRIETNLNTDIHAVEFKMGIVDSNFQVFGWDMNIPVADLPLKKGYSRKLILGGSPMILTYDGATLSFQYLPEDELLTRIYPFELVIDENLQNPKAFKGSLEGWEMSGKHPKKHVVEECQF
jgi:hypothetical protein